MKVHVLYDPQGNIISIGVPAPLGYDFRGPIFNVKAESGQHASELELSEEQAHLGLANIAEKLHVDVGSKPHKLALKP